MALPLIHVQHTRAVPLLNDGLGLLRTGAAAEPWRLLLDAVLGMSRVIEVAEIERRLNELTARLEVEQ